MTSHYFLPFAFLPTVFPRLPRFLALRFLAGCATFLVFAAGSLVSQAGLPTPTNVELAGGANTGAGVCGP